MSNYLSGGLMLLLIASFSLLGLQAFDIFDAARAVDAALLDAQVKLALDGGVTPEVLRLARERIAAEGKDPDRLHIEGTAPHAPFGEMVRIKLTYRHPYMLGTLMPSHLDSGTFHIERRAVAVSGWLP